MESEYETDAGKNQQLREAIDHAIAEDPTRFLERSFAVIENAGHSIRLIKRDDARQVISIPWEDLPALRQLLSIILDEITSSEAPAPPTPSEAAQLAAREIVTQIEVEREPHPAWSSRARAKYVAMAVEIISRYCGTIAEQVNTCLKEVKDGHDH